MSQTQDPAVLLGQVAAVWVELVDSTPPAIREAVAQVVEREGVRRWLAARGELARDAAEVHPLLGDVETVEVDHRRAAPFARRAVEEREASTIVIDSTAFPEPYGVAISPDGSTLYVCDVTAAVIRMERLSADGRSPRAAR